MMNIRAEEQKAGRRCIVATGISTKKNIWLVVTGNMFYDFPFSWEYIIIPTDFRPSFFRGVGIPPTRYGLTNNDHVDWSSNNNNNSSWWFDQTCSNVQVSHPFPAENWGPKKKWMEWTRCLCLGGAHSANNQGVATRAGPYPDFFQVPGFLGVESVALFTRFALRMRALCPLADDEGTWKTVQDLAEFMICQCKSCLGYGRIGRIIRKWWDLPGSKG